MSCGRKLWSDFFPGFRFGSQAQDRVLGSGLGLEVVAVAALVGHGILYFCCGGWICSSATVSSDFSIVMEGKVSTIDRLFKRHIFSNLPACKLNLHVFFYKTLKNDPVLKVS